MSAGTRSYALVISSALYPRRSCQTTMYCMVMRRLSMRFSTPHAGRFHDALLRRLRSHDRRMKDGKSKTLY